MAAKLTVFGFIFAVALIQISLADDPSVYFYGNYSIKEYCTRSKVDEKLLTCGRNSNGGPLGNGDVNPTDALAVKIKIQNIVIDRLEKAIFFPGHDHSQIQHLIFVNTSTMKVENEMFNDMTALTDLEFEQMASLKSICHRVLTPEVGSRLLSLVLSSTKNTSIPSNVFQNLKALKFLTIQVPNPEILNGIFTEDLKNLQLLKLENSNIESLDDGIFENLIHLEHLYFDKNPLKAIPRAINKLPNLKTMSLKHTLITTLSHDAELLNDNLELFNMGHIPSLTTIEDCAFCSFPSLKFITFFNDTSLSDIHENAFGNVKNDGTKIEKLWVEYANLTTIPEKLLDWNKVTEFQACKNPLRCDCSMEWFIDMVKKDEGKRFHKIKHLTCSDGFGERPLMDVDVSSCPQATAETF